MKDFETVTQPAYSN